MYTQRLSQYPRTSRNMHKNKKKMEFSSLNPDTRIAWLLAFHMPGKCSELTLHFLLEGYILSLLDALTEENLESKETIVHCCLTCLCLSLHPYVPLEHIVLLFPSFPLFCKLSIEMEDWIGGGPGGGLGFSILTRYRQSFSQFYLCLL